MTHLDAAGLMGCVVVGVPLAEPLGTARWTAAGRKHPKGKPESR